MKAFEEFRNLDRSFWAHIKLISERLGYSERATKADKSKRLKRYTIEEIIRCFTEAGLSTKHLTEDKGNFAALLQSYLNFRSEALENTVASNLMNKKEAFAEYSKLRRSLRPKCALPMNKQRGSKRHPAFMVGIVNMLTEHALGGKHFEDEPRGLTVVTKNGKPLRTFSRWMDGAYPTLVDPIAVWEIKEYYDTTTFGSRVADGVYETMLDGEEFGELELKEKRKVFHYLIVDDRFTWWDCGRSYLCRIFDILHMGLVDEVIFGREVITRWPEIVAEWP